jgi:hypothetical protein
MQAVSISFVPLFRNVERTPPDGVCIHLSLLPGSMQVRTPPNHKLPHTPLTGVEAVSVVNERCGVPSASRCLATKDRLPAIAVARPLVQDQSPREVTNIHDLGNRVADQGPLDPRGPI